MLIVLVPYIFYAKTIHHKSECDGYGGMALETWHMRELKSTKGCNVLF